MKGGINMDLHLEVGEVEALIKALQMAIPAQDQYEKITLGYNMDSSILSNMKSIFEKLTSK